MAAQVTHLSKLAGYHRVERRFPEWDFVDQRRSHPTDAFAQLRQMRQRFSLAINFAAAIGPKITAGDAQQRSFSRTIWTEDRPVLAGLHSPVDGIQDLFAVGAITDAA